MNKENLARMKEYEKRTGRRVIYTFKERTEIYRGYGIEALKRAEIGFLDSLENRAEFDGDLGLDQEWTLEVLKEELKAVEQVLEERAKIIKPVEGYKPPQSEGGRKNDRSKNNR